ncbi:glycosyltransferase family 4 protein [Bacteroides sp.]|uniref:glycosyltransferase family 4 protein n=1 Tax=Bacteroides sp. TaxID=29523 RepID=UPI0026127893|nr:glycosyltransferase [Bacteroides sp.]MDD3040468.1 glycosyltransferase [Bacteroides sp.]
MKILINCYACSPYKGSEPGMGWKFVHGLSKEHELHVIVEGEKFKEHIDRYYLEHPENKGAIKFYFINKVRHRTLRKIWPPSYYWFYNDWQKKALKLAQKLDAKEHFDVVHQLNMVGFREPGYLWKLDKPFVWGPIGGFCNSPWKLLHTMGLYGVVFYGMRNLMNSWQMHTIGRVKKAAQKASQLIAATNEDRIALKRLYGKDSIIIPEVGLEDAAINELCKREDGEKLRICWSGQHTPGKALNLLLEALNILDRKDIELHVIGKGQKNNEWKKMAKRLGLQYIVWHGWMERSEALQIMQSCHLFCITSLKDLTSTVLLESLSYGMPVIALDHCGFSNVLTYECGRKIAIESKDQVVHDFAAAIYELADDESLRRKLSEGARNRALEYNWPDKAKTIDEIYRNVAK